MTERSASNTFMIAALAGLAGAGLAILFAPKSGRETRQQLKQKAEMAKNKADEKMEHTKEKVDQTRQKAYGLKHRLGEAVHNTKGTAKEELGDVRDEVS